MTIDFKADAMQFTKEHGFAVPWQVIERAMQHGACVALKEASSLVNTAGKELEDKRIKNISGQ